MINLELRDEFHRQRLDRRVDGHRAVGKRNEDEPET